MANKNIEDFIPKDMESLFLSVANLNMDYSERLNEDPTLPNPDLYMYYDGLKNRTIWLDDTVDETTAIPITKMILAWNREDNEKNIPPNCANQLNCLYIPAAVELRKYSILQI